jgi:hypothetical protein
MRNWNTVFIEDQLNWILMLNSMYTFTAFLNLDTKS